MVLIDPLELKFILKVRLFLSIFLIMPKAITFYYIPRTTQRACKEQQNTHYFFKPLLRQ